MNENQRYYKLGDDRVPVSCEIDEMDWNETTRRVAETFVKTPLERFINFVTFGKCTVQKDTRISTVFLCIDHSYLCDSLPVLFETAIFGGKHDGEMERYGTWDQAEIGHKKWVSICEHKQKEKVRCQSS